MIRDLGETGQITLTEWAGPFDVFPVGTLVLSLTLSIDGYVYGQRRNKSVKHLNNCERLGFFWLHMTEMKLKIV